MGSLLRRWRRLGLVLAFAMAATAVAVAEDSLVPEGLRVSDLEARSQLAEWLSYQPEHRGEAVALFRELLAEVPGKEEWILALLRLYGDLGDRAAMEALGEAYPEIVESSAQWWLLRADHALAAGRLAEARDLLAEAEQRMKDDRRGLAELEKRRLAWGDFNGVAARMDRWLREGHDTPDVRETLAEALHAGGRRPEAEAVLRGLLDADPSNHSARLLLVRVLRSDKRFGPAIVECERLLAQRLDWPEARHLRLRLAIEGWQDENDWLPPADWIEGAGLAPVEIAWRQRRFKDASELLAGFSPRTGEEERLKRFWEELLEPEGTMDRLSEALIREYASDSLQLHAWARRMTEYGHAREALRLLEAGDAIAAGVDAFRFEKAESLGIAGEYERSVALYEELLKRFPESSKLDVGRARVLSWDRRYEDSLEAYTQLHARYPEDPEILREMARVAGWGKRFDKAREAFALLFMPSLDFRIGWREEADERDLLGDGRVRRPYAAYEAADPEERSGAVPRFEPGARGPYHTATMDAHTLYRLQKGAFLEFRAKERLRRFHFLRAERLLEELVGLEPANFEARFDLAQVRCSIGLAETRDEAYRSLLQIQPLHDMAERALEYGRIRRHPALLAQFAFSREKGSERLADMRITRTNLGGLFHATAQSRISLSIFQQWESPEDPDFGRERAEGFRLEASNVFNAYLSGSLSFQDKRYDRPGLRGRRTGHIGLQGRYEDWLQPRLRWSRQENLSNGFARQDRIVFDQWELGGLFLLSREWDLDLVGHWERYHDQNRQVALRARPTWMWTDHPRELRLVGQLEYRDSREQNVFIFENGELERIIHPYWTPDNYVNGGLGLLWRHDLAEEYFCGNLEHFYTIQFDVNAADDRNRGFGIEALWRRDWNAHWRTELSGRLYRSRQWDHHQLAAYLHRRF